MSKRGTLDRTGRPIDTYVDEETMTRLKVDDLSLDDTAARRRPGYTPPAHVKVGSNPYDGGSVASGKKLQARSRLDYMRALSEEIKKKRREEGKD